MMFPLRFPRTRPRSSVFASVLSFALLASALFLGCQREGRAGDGATSAHAPGTTTSAPVPMGKPGEFPQIFADVAENALPAVVSIYTETDVSPQDYADPLEQFFGEGAPESAPRRESGLGSGVILDEDGTILTNNHVIEGASRIRIQFHDGSEFDAVVIGADAPTDLAVIRVKPGKEGKDGKSGAVKFRALPLGDSERLRVGEWVIAVGSPYGLSETVTTGIISAKGRHNTGINSYENFLQTDAAINPGNSGGALLNLRGELVGINTAIFSRSGGYQGIGFAIPIAMARKISAALIRDGAVTRGWLGVSIQPLDAELAEALGIPDRSGALVGGVLARSPAEKAGIRRGDVITRIDKLPIPDPNTLLNHVALLSPGTWIEVGLNRAGKSMTLKARVAKREDAGEGRSRAGEGGDSRLASLGLALDALTPDLRRDYGITGGVAGALVLGVEIDSRADRAGLQEGDVIVEANRLKVRSPRDVQEAVRKAGKNGRILLVVNREGETFFTTL
jgi:serine protease Do